MISSNRGESRAEDLLRRAADGFAGEGEATGEVYSRLGLAHWFIRRERGVEARLETDLAAEVADGSGDQTLLARVRLEQGWRAVTDRNFAKSRAFFNEVEKLSSPDGPFDLRYGVVSGLGYVDWATGRYRAALAHYRRQAAMCAEAGDLFEETAARYNVALMAAQIVRTPEDNERIEALAREALNAAMRSGDRELEARLHLMLATPIDGSPEHRLEASKALDAAREATIPELEIQAERTIALHDLVSKPQDPLPALDRLRRVVAHARDQGNLHEEISSRIVLAGALWSHVDQERGLAESLAALDLVDQMRNLQSEDEERARIASTWSHAFYQPIGRLLETGEPESAELALQIMERLRAHGLIDLLEAADASVGNSSSGQELSLETVQAALHEDEVLVSYQLADRFDLGGAHQGGAWIIFITREGVEAHQLPDRREIEAAVEVYLGLVRSGNSREAKASHRIFEMILGPVRERVTNDAASIVIVPDGVLAALPLTALRPDPDAPPLVDSFSVTTAPSVTRWLGWRTPSVAGRGSEYLGIADPERDTSMEIVEPLPYARAEVRRACRKLGGNSRSLIGASATETAVKEQLKDSFDVVHFATHAEVDRSDPAKTAILLGTEGQEEDGHLRIAEISSLRLREPLVILSACHSAGGVVLQGEGVLGLTRAFFEGGARSVVGNLWPIADRDAALLMDRFFHHLAAGSSVATALSRAQRDRWESGDPTRAWAGMVVIGDGAFEIAPAQGASRWRLATIVLLSITGVAVLMWLLRLRSR